MNRKLVSKLLGWSGAFALALLVTVAPVSAAVILSFDNTAESGGTLSYDGAGGPAVGSEIEFNVFSASGTGLTDGEYDCVDCVLEFTTGANTFESGALWTWDGGGSFVITGTIVDPITLAVIATGTLLEGFFEGPVAAAAILGAANIITFSGSGVDTKHEDIMAFFGISPNDWSFANTEITMMDCTPDANNGFNCDVVNADVDNFHTPRDVPEPGSLALLGMGLLGFATAVRRRVRG